MEIQQYRSRRRRWDAPFYPRSKLLRLRLMNYAITASIIGAAAAVVLTIGMFVWYSRDLPSPEGVKRKEGFSTVVLDRQEQPLYDIYTDKDRIPIPFSDMSETLRKATIAIEDKDFYKHQGFDPRGILRAFFRIITFRSFEGGSTLTQQLVKNVLLTSEQTLPRKIKELVLAIAIERKYTKDEILQMYLNESPYGGTMWGIESAAKGYFRKHAKDLTDPEAVILAGLPQRPSYYSPTNGADQAYLTRAQEVLRRMREDGTITQAQEAEFKHSIRGVTFATESAGLKAPHFIAWVKKQLIERFGEKTVEKGGLRVITTLDGDLQETAETVIRDEIDKLKTLSVTNGAAVTINPQTGEILAYVGSKSYESEDDTFQGKFDVVSLGERQPGSALKPIAYAVAFTKGYTPSSILMDVETHFPAGEGKPDYIPKNYDGKFRGPVQIRFALGNSINVAAVKITALVGIRDILKTSYDMGLTTLEPTDKKIQDLGLSLVLGGGEVRLLELTDAYGVFATGGLKSDIYGISKVIDSTGSILYEHTTAVPRRVIGEDVSFLISHILYDNEARKEVFGERSHLVVPGRTVSVKTGTTDDKRDNWTVGYTPSVVTGVWVGNNDNSPMNPKVASGVTGAAPIWNKIMRFALKDKTAEEFRKPDNVISMEIDAFGGGLPHGDRPKRSEYFIKGTEPTSEATIYKKLKLSKEDNNKLANAVEIASGQYDEKDFIVFSESDPTSLDEKVNKWQEGIDAWLGKQDNTQYKWPKETSNRNENSVIVQIKRPSDKSRIDDNRVEIEAKAVAQRDIKKMELYIDDSQKASVNNNTMNETLNLDTGIHKIKVKAYDDGGNSGESEIRIGVNVNPEEPSPTDTPVPTP